MEKGKLFIEVARNTKPENLDKIWKKVQELQKKLPDYDPKPFRDFQRHAIYTKMIEDYETGKETAKEIIDRYGIKISTDYFYKIRRRLRKNSV